MLIDMQLQQSLEITENLRKQNGVDECGTYRSVHQKKKKKYNRVK